MNYGQVNFFPSLLPVRNLEVSPRHTRTLFLNKKRKQLSSLEHVATCFPAAAILSLIFKTVFIGHFIPRLPRSSEFSFESHIPHQQWNFLENVWPSVQETGSALEIPKDMKTVKTEAGGREVVGLRNRTHRSSCAPHMD